MNDLQAQSASSIDDTGEWRPFTVWATTVRDTDTAAPADNQKKDAKESWDPYAVWKRQVRR